MYTNPGEPFMGNDMEKEMMGMKDFLEIYGLSRSRYFLEKVKYPWLTTRIGKRVYIRRKDADRWLDEIKNPS